MEILLGVASANLRNLLILWCVKVNQNASQCRIQIKLFTETQNYLRQI